MRNIASLDSGGAAPECMMWSADETKFAWWSDIQGTTSVHIYDLKTQQRTNFDIHESIVDIAMALSPDGTRYLAGFNSTTDTRALVEYDALSGAVVRAFSRDQIDGHISWARYSNLGGRLVATVEPNAAVAASNRQTIVIDADNSIREIASGKAALSNPIWSKNDRWLIHKRRSTQHKLIRGVNRIVGVGEPPSTDSIVLTDIDQRQPELVVDQVPSQVTSIWTHASPNLRVRYEVQDIPSQTSLGRWEIWEWNEATGKKVLLFDLRKALQIIGGTIANGYVWPTDDPNLVLVVVAPSAPNVMYCSLHLGAQPRIERIVLPSGTIQNVRFSPKGRMLSYVDGEMACHVLEIVYPQAMQLNQQH